MSRLVEEETDYPVIRWFAECEEMRLVVCVSDVSPKCLYEK